MQGSSKPDRQLLDAAAFCRHLVEEGSVHGFLAEHRHEVFPDEMFADLFPSERGRPSVPADVIATVMVLQSLEGLSDREACWALRTDIRWKVACGLPLDDEGFHPTVLVLWRNRLRTSDNPERIFEAVRKVVDQSGVLSKKNRRALDSTVLEDAVQRQDTISLLQSQIRRVRKLVPELAAGVYVHELNLGPGRPPCDFEDQDDIDRLVSELVEDANELVFAVEDLGLQLDELQEQAVALLALLAGQDVEPVEGKPGRWRIAQRTAPDRVLSSVDPESRHAHKTQHSYRDGYKAHIAAEPETGIVTAVDLTAGNSSDGEVALDLLEEEPEGTEVLADAAYGSGELRADLESAGFSPVIKPLPLQPAVEGGFTLDDFEIDQEQNTITCPNGVTVKINAHRRARFGKNCASCPMRKKCTKSKAGRTIVLNEHHDLLAEARRQSMTGEFQHTYRSYRPMIERTIAWMTRGPNRKLRYRGSEKNRLWLFHRAAAVNLMRLLNLGLAKEHGAWTMAPAR
jgi:IS5 family transposase